MKKLYKSRTNKVWAGVFGGIGEYFNVDPTLIRLVYTFMAIFTGLLPGLLMYIVAACIVPQPPSNPSTPSA